MNIKQGIGLVREMVAFLYESSGYPVAVRDQNGMILASAEGAISEDGCCEPFGQGGAARLRESGRPGMYTEETLFIDNQPIGSIRIYSMTETAKLLARLAAGGIPLLLKNRGNCQDLHHRIREYQALFNVIPIPIWYKDTTNKTIQINQQIEGKFFISNKDFLETNVKELFPGYSQKYYEDDVEVLYSGKPKFSIIEQIRNSSGDIRWGYASTIAKADYHEEVIGLVAVVVDITESKKIKNQMPIWAKIFESSGEAISVTDQKNRFIAVNRAFSLATGYSADEIMGKEPNILKSGFHDKAFYQNMWASIIQTGFWEGEIWEKRKDGVIYLKWLRIDQIKDEKGHLMNYLARFTDISEKKATEERIRYLARYDALTGLINREVLGKELKKEMEKARHQGKRVGVIAFNLDRFKNINDSLGHNAGDEVLRELADRLRNCSKRISLAARFGGDTFNFIVPDVVQKEEVVKVIYEVIEALERPLLHGQLELIVTASIGVSIFPDDGHTAEVLIQNADTAMHKVKENGRNFYEFFEANMNEYVSDRLMLENRLRHALARKEFILFYQPQVACQSEEVIGVEALIRWGRPNSEVVSPGDFIPVLEETGMIIPVGRWVLAEACRQHKEWIQKGLPPIPISVNISALQFQEEDFLEMLSDIIKESGIEPGYLDLELTESIVMQQPEYVIKQLERIKQMGITLSLDDFGTGFSSLSYLRYFPLDRLKIDQSFVRGLTTDSVNEAIIEAVVALGKSLKIKTIAEGVEEKEELDFLRKLKCDEIQGYYFSKPLSSEAFVRWFSAR